MPNRLIRAFLFVAMLLLMGNTANSADPNVVLAGFWKPMSVNYEGEEQINAETGKGLTLVIKDGEYRVYYLSDPEKDLHYRLFTADLKLNPADKSFELHIKDGKMKGARRHGIYEVDGNKMKLCYGSMDSPRPKEFNAPKGSEFFSEVWVKEKSTR